jgi:hypothetical protein
MIQAIQENIEKVFRRIVSKNSLLDSNAIPHSDVFYNEIESSMGLTKAEIDIIISILDESHKIFVMEISKEDKGKKIEKVQGYIDADYNTVQKLKTVFHRLLEGEYENYAGKKKTAHQIIKEMIPKLHYINNSPMGRILNKAIMLDEYDRLLDRGYKEYTEEWKEENLKIQIEINSGIFKDINAEKNSPPPEIEAPVKKAVRRAVDSPLHEDYLKQSSRSSINKLLKIYGIEFFFRVNLRNYKFTYLKSILESGVIERKQDLLVIKGMISKVKNHIEVDRDLENYADDIQALDRIMTRLISFSKK